MRVVTGSARGRKLITLEGNDVRPTTDRVKEGIFSAVQFEISGKTFLDLFAGSGQMGIEALSRGAKSAVFTDSASSSVNVIKKNLEICGFTKQAIVKTTEASDFLSFTRDKFDIIFMDPPYDQGLLEKNLPAASKVLSEDGVIICESRIEASLPETVGMLSISKTYKYGKIKVTMYRKSEG